MTSLRRLRWIAPLMSLWLAATVAAAALAPHFVRGGDVRVLCSVQGLKLVRVAGAPAGDMPASAAHCPLCLLGALQGAPPAVQPLAVLALAHALPAVAPVVWSARPAPLPSARGPPRLA